LYEKEGKFTIILEATNENAVDTISKTISIQPKPIACFDYSPKDNLKTGDTIKIINCSENSDNFTWTFGDGSTSNEKLPYYVYEKEGDFTIHLEAINGHSIDTISKAISIVDKNYTDLHNTTLYVMGGYGNDSRTYELDLDKDKIPDISFLIASSLYHFSDAAFIKLTTFNGYEINTKTFFDTTHRWEFLSPGTIYRNDSITLPREFYSGDLIRMDQNYSGKAFWLTCAEGGGTQGGNIYKYYHLSFGKELFIGFRQLNENRHKLGWIKLQLVGFRHMILMSTYYVENKKELIIKNR